MTNISPDTLALLLICSHLAAPYTLREWNRLERILAAAGIQPGSLLGSTATGLREPLQFDPAEAERLSGLLERADEMHAALVSLADGTLCLLTPYSPDTGFSIGAAMGCNRLIYTLADVAIVVASDAGKSGTWAGASEAIKAKWAPVFALEYAGAPEGNRLLLQKGALSFPYPPTGPSFDLQE